MSDAEILHQKAEMFERRAEGATDPISKQQRNGGTLPAAPSGAPRRAARTARNCRLKCRSKKPAKIADMREQGVRGLFTTRKG